MACFSLGWVEQLCIWLIILGATVAIIRVVVPWLLGMIGGVSAPIVQIINIVLWAVIAIMVVYVVFALIACLVGGGGLPLFPHR